MDQVRNRPRVFLSHSKRDVPFVKRVYDDLRRCQIDPWLDSEEIRHGQPWLEAIFESGIPTCDCVLVYLTPNSLGSALVKKEIDASLITKLRESHVLFLPYVSETRLRKELRRDIEALQTPEWNDANYQDLLPRVVSEIWRGFMERTIVAAKNEEKVKRLEAELELNRLKSEHGGVFSDSEDKDFQYIWSALDRWVPFDVARIEGEAGNQNTIERATCFVRVRSIVPFLGGPKDFEHDEYSVRQVMRARIARKLPLREDRSNNIRVDLYNCPDLQEELLMFGLIERRERPQRGKEERQPFAFSHRHRTSPQPYTTVYTQKAERLKYWLSFNRLLPTEIEWTAEQPTQADN